MSIFSSPKKTAYLCLAVVSILVLASTACSLGSSTGSGSIPTATPLPGAKPGDYGDAPDGDHNLDTGYYAPTGGPWLFTYESAGIAANFPTIGDDPIPGAFTVDVDEFWIGPLFGGSSTADIPSIEDDADDPNDPDNVPNLQIQGGGADCDAENGSHNPAGNGCAPVPAYSLPMNARLMIFFGSPPLGVWITSVHASETMSYSGPIYWNLLYDLNQDGSWSGSDEWVAQDIAVDLSPGETKTLISPAFRLATSGTPWGRLHFPNWARSMVSSESVADKLGSTTWDGRGPENGFAVGEVEDYFVEWQPIGQKFPKQEPQQAAGCAAVSSELLEALPSSRNAWDLIELIPGADVDHILVTGYENTTLGGVGIPIEMVELNLSSVTPIKIGDSEVTITVDENRKISVEPRIHAVRGFNILLIPVLVNNIICSGIAPVFVSPGFEAHYNERTGESVFTQWGPYGMALTVIIDKAGHVTFVGMPKELIVDIFSGSISIEGPAPWVNVYGEYDEDTGSFSAEGTGTVAGFPNIKVTYVGTLDESGVTGEYTMGADGGLPAGEPIVYKAEGTRLEETAEEPPDADAGPAPLAQGVQDAIESFVTVFNTAFQDKNVDHLYQLLHPEVIDLYGEESCRAYIEGIVEIPTSLEYLDASYVGGWNFERDGVVIPVDFAYSVFANFTSNEQTIPQELHLTLPGDDSVRWFTDCGEPIGSE